MQDVEENIKFDTMSNFGMMFGSRQDEWSCEKAYDSLYDELVDKCQPDKFTRNTSDRSKYQYATKLYGELMNRRGVSDGELIELRDRAMLMLGIHISTKKLYDNLEQYFNPSVYTTMKPFDEERVALAGDYYFRFQDNKDDIHALEQLQRDAADFIGRRVKEEEDEREATLRFREEQHLVEQREEDERERSIVLFVSMLFLLVIGILAAVVSVK